ncbi:hypothetical protein DY000_02040035 [Brassica cretica]|uniref:DUF3741 domain-containing protein n=1 Tax=Brassica cretica TaxID=69181 RepID=A0ABQ7BLX9_BRACR|nr:hypothetical protein DY000_02040035 [Brassica cretica]
MSRDIGELSESDEGEPDLSREEPDLRREEPNELASLWSGPVTRSRLRAQEKSLQHLAKSGEPDLSREEPYLSRKEPNELASLWSGPVTRSRLRAQEKSLQHLAKSVGLKSEEENQDKPGRNSLVKTILDNTGDPGAEAIPRLHQVVSEPLEGLGFNDFDLGARIPSTIQQSSMSSHKKQGDKAKQPAIRKRVAANQTLIFSEQQLDDLAAEIFNQIMRGRGSKQMWERSDLKTSKERNLLALDQFGRWSSVPPETRENIQLVPELSTSKVCKTGNQTSKPCSQTAEKVPEKVPEIESILNIPFQGENSVIQLKQEEHVPVALSGHTLDLTEDKEEEKLDAALVVHKESSATLIEQDLQLWPHHPRPRQNVIHADMRSMESLYHTPSMCGKTRDNPREARHGPRLKSEYGDHCTGPPDQENHVR